jgi:hypothetical protein
MGDQTEKKIEEVKVGDKVESQSEDGKKLISTVTKLELPVRDNMCQINFTDGEKFRLTSEHPVFSQDGWKSIDINAIKKEMPNLAVIELKKGDKLVKADGTWAQVDSFACWSTTAQTYNLILDGGAHTYFAGGFLVHNKGQPIIAFHGLVMEDFNGNGTYDKTYACGSKTCTDFISGNPRGSSCSGDSSAWVSNLDSTMKLTRPDRSGNPAVKFESQWFSNGTCADEAYDIWENAGDTGRYQLTPPSGINCSQITWRINGGSSSSAVLTGSGCLTDVVTLNVDASAYFYIAPATYHCTRCSTTNGCEWVEFDSYHSDCSTGDLNRVPSTNCSCPAISGGDNSRCTSYCVPSCNITGNSPVLQNSSNSYTITGTKNSSSYALPVSSTDIINRQIIPTLGNWSAVTSCSGALPCSSSYSFANVGTYLVAANAAAGIIGVSGDSYDYSMKADVREYSFCNWTRMDADGRGCSFSYWTQKNAELL